MGAGGEVLVAARVALLRRTSQEDEVGLAAGMKPQARELGCTQGLNVMLIQADSPINGNNAKQLTKRLLQPL